MPLLLELYTITISFEAYCFLAYKGKVYVSLSAYSWGSLLRADQRDAVKINECNINERPMIYATYNDDDGNQMFVFLYHVQMNHTVVPMDIFTRFYYRLENDCFDQDGNVIDEDRYEALVSM